MPKIGGNVYNNFHIVNNFHITPSDAKKIITNLNDVSRGRFATLQNEVFTNQNNQIKTKSGSKKINFRDKIGNSYKKAKIDPLNTVTNSISTIEDPSLKTIASPRTITKFHIPQIERRNISENIKTVTKLKIANIQFAEKIVTPNYKNIHSHIAPQNIESKPTKFQLKNKNLQLKDIYGFFKHVSSNNTPKTDRVIDFRKSDSKKLTIKYK